MSVLKKIGPNFHKINSTDVALNFFIGRDRERERKKNNRQTVSESSNKICFQGGVETGSMYVQYVQGI